MACRELREPTTLSVSVAPSDNHTNPSGSLCPLLGPGPASAYLIRAGRAAFVISPNKLALTSRATVEKVQKAAAPSVRHGCKCAQPPPPSAHNYEYFVQILHFSAPIKMSAPVRSSWRIRRAVAVAVILGTKSTRAIFSAPAVCRRRAVRNNDGDLNQPLPSESSSAFHPCIQPPRCRLLTFLAHATFVCLIRYKLGKLRDCQTV